MQTNGSLILGSSRNSQLQISPAISFISISCISRWRVHDKGSYTTEIRRFGLDFLWQKWDQNLVSSFYTLGTCLCLLDLRLDGDWPGGAGFKKEIKPIVSVSRKKKQLFYLLIHTKKKPIFLSQKNPRKWFFILGETAETTRKVLFPRIFLQGRCTSHPNDHRGLVCCAAPVLQRRIGCISPELQVNNVLMLRSDHGDQSSHQSQQWCCCPSSGYISTCHGKFTGNSSFWLFYYHYFHYQAEKLMWLRDSERKLKESFLCEISSKFLKLSVLVHLVCKPGHSVSGGINLLYQELWCHYQKLQMFLCLHVETKARREFWLWLLFVAYFCWKWWSEANMNIKRKNKVAETTALENSASQQWVIHFHSALALKRGEQTGL